MGHGGRVYAPETSSCYACPLPFPETQLLHIRQTRCGGGTCVGREGGRAPTPPAGAAGFPFHLFPGQRDTLTFLFVRTLSPRAGGEPKTTSLCSQPVGRGGGKDSSAPGSQRPQHQHCVKGLSPQAPLGWLLKVPRAQGNISYFWLIFCPLVSLIKSLDDGRGMMASVSPVPVRIPGHHTNEPP